MIAPRLTKASSRWLIGTFACIATYGVLVTSAFAQEPTSLQAPAATPAPSAENKTDAPIFAGFMDPFDYDTRGRRDPFAQPIDDRPVEQGGVHGPLLPLQKFELNQLRLMGILWNVRAPKAMLQDPDGQVHIVGPNAKVGPHNGYIAVIREGEIVVVETFDQNGRLVSAAQVVKIAK